MCTFTNDFTDHQTYQCLKDLDIPFPRHLTWTTSSGHPPRTQPAVNVVCIKHFKKIYDFHLFQNTILKQRWREKCDVISCRKRFSCGSCGSLKPHVFFHECKDCYSTTFCYVDYRCIKTWLTPFSEPAWRGQKNTKFKDRSS